MATDKYDMLRNRVGQEALKEKQQSNQAMKRKFARLGGLNSGAFVKSSEQADQAIENRKAKNLENIGFQQTTEQERLAEIQAGRDFSKGEREAGQGFAESQGELGRKFASEQGQLGRQFARGERLGGQEFAGRQAQFGRDFASGERKDSQTFAAGQAVEGRTFAKGERLAAQTYGKEAVTEAQRIQQEQFGVQSGLAQLQFESDELTTEFNKKLAAFIAGSSLDDIMALGSRMQKVFY